MIWLVNVAKSKFIKDNGVDLIIVTETWLSTQGDEAKTVELAPSRIDVKSLPRQSRSRGCGIATICKSTLGSSIAIEANLDFAHTCRHQLIYSTTHYIFSVCTALHQTDETILLTLC